MQQKQFIESKLNEFEDTVGKTIVIEAGDEWYRRYQNGDATINSEYGELLKSFLSTALKEIVEEERKNILKELRGIEVSVRGAELLDGTEVEIPKELIDDMQKFEVGYTTCLNEVKKMVLALDQITSRHKEWGE